MSTTAKTLANRRNAQKSTGPRGERSKINQFEAIMQNKPNLPNALMNANTVKTKDYENKRLCRCVKTNPIQTQYKAKTNPNKPNSRNVQNERKLICHKGL